MRVRRGCVRGEADLPDSLRTGVTASRRNTGGRNTPGPCRYFAGPAARDAHRASWLALRLQQAHSGCTAGGDDPGTPFGPNIHALLAYLHHSQHVGFERPGRLAAGLFGLKISAGAIANALYRRRPLPEAQRAEILEKLRAAGVVWSHETTTRISGCVHWHSVFVTPDAVLHKVAPRREEPRSADARCSGEGVCQ